MFNQLIFSILTIVLTFSVSVPPTNPPRYEINKCRDWYLESDFPALYGVIATVVAETDVERYQSMVGDGIEAINAYATLPADECFLELRDRFVRIAFDTLLYKNLLAYGEEHQLRLPAALLTSLTRLVVDTHEWESDMCDVTTLFCREVNPPPDDFSPDPDQVREAR